MHKAIAALGIAVAALAAGQRMDSSVGGVSVDTSAQPCYDARQRLYLFSGGD